MIESIRRTLRERWKELGLPGETPARLAIHLDSGDERAHGFVTFAALRAGDRAPLCVGRIPRDGLATRDALHEHALLESMREESPHVVRSLVPRPLFVVERGARIATARTVLPGEPGPLAARRSGRQPRRIDASLRIARRWLNAFTRTTGLLEATEGALWEPFLRSLHFERRSIAAEDHPRLDALAAAIDERRGRTALCGFGHGALTLDAFRVHGDRIGAQDWEHGRSRQAPWTDPIHFALDLALREIASPEEATAAVLDPAHPIGSFVLDCLEDAGVTADVLPLAVPAVALGAAHRTDRAGGISPSAALWRRAALAACPAADPVPSY